MNERRVFCTMFLALLPVLVQRVYGAQAESNKPLAEFSQPPPEFSQPPRAFSKPLPEFSWVRECVRRDFSNITDYRPGDILSQSDVTPIFEHLRLMGWDVKEEKGILGQVPQDGDFVVRQLRTEPGRKFMHKISGYPLAYDRLSRLATLPGGRQMVHDLIKGKGGDEMVRYLTTSEGGANLGKMLERTPKGVDFNAPTGRIYTAEQLLQRLKKSYDAERERRAARQHAGEKG
jgi:hypothetical protein